MSLPSTTLPLSTPSLLFPAISLLMLAYTNRFLGLASVVRALHANWKATGEPMLLAQIRTLRRRIRVIQHTQTLGGLSLMTCIVSMTLLFFDLQGFGQIAFGTSLALMFASLGLSLREIHMSSQALDLLLRDVECREE